MHTNEQCEADDIGLAGLSDAEAWRQTANLAWGNVDYYRRLLDQIAGYLGEAAFTGADGRRADEPIRAKLPELVRRLAMSSVSDGG